MDLEYRRRVFTRDRAALVFFAEVYGTLSLGANRLDQHSFQTGITTLLGNDFQLDARVGVGLVDNVPAWLTGFGIGLAPLAAFNQETRP